MILSFGKYKGQDLQDVPQDYVEWLRDRTKADLDLYTEELERRAQIETASLSLAERMVQAGFRVLSKEAHPDAGGSADKFIQVKGAFEQLKVVLKELEKAGLK